MPHSSEVVSMRRDVDDKEIKHKIKMDAVAKLIVPVGPPPWLRDVLSDLSFKVWSDQSIETIQPTRGALYKQLLIVNQASFQLSGALQSPFIAAFLEQNSDFPYESRQSEIVATLSGLIVASKRTIDALQLLTTDRKKVRPGAGKPRLANVLQPKYACAAIISELIRFFEGDDPAPSNKRAWNAADRLWNSWILPPKKLVENPLAKWERYFEGAPTSNLEPTRKEVRRLLQKYSSRPIA
jgi:hypothetical protein